jgi:hypothetical protein
LRLVLDINLQEVAAYQEKRSASRAERRSQELQVASH